MPCTHTGHADAMMPLIGIRRHDAAAWGRWMRGRAPNELTTTTLLLFLASGQLPSITYHPFSLPMLFE